MAPMSATELLWSLVGVVLTALTAWYKEHRQSKRIRAKAREILSDPDLTNSPESAVTRATVETLKPRIKRLSVGLANGVGKSER